ncbi:MAG: aminotransferase class V-fold PLP-dependent enzyme, partial [Planctomycetota bacterium]|nr:aminotransferase class V-fold PLP-dependent enzyme [Planctomycetota bacterium]
HHCAMLLHDQLGIAATTRASFAIYNTPAEIEILCAGIRDAVRLFRRIS